ncbi:MAG: hypothetical protein V4581_11045, partial [Bacteroidota bacterium]
MKRIVTIIIALITLSGLSGCGIYSFTGANVDPSIKTFQVNFFQNTAEVVEPGIERRFTIRLQDLIQNQTNLSLTNT